MFRNVKDMVNVVELWISQGVNVRFVDYPALNTHTASGKALLQIFAVMAQLRSELASARVREALAIKRHRLQEPPVDRAERERVADPAADAGSGWHDFAVDRNESG